MYLENSGDLSEVIDYGIKPAIGFLRHAENLIIDDDDYDLALMFSREARVKLMKIEEVLERMIEIWKER